MEKLSPSLCESSLLKIDSSSRESLLKLACCQTQFNKCKFRPVSLNNKEAILTARLASLHLISNPKITLPLLCKQLHLMQVGNIFLSLRQLRISSIRPRLLSFSMLNHRILSSSISSQTNQFNLTSSSLSNSNKCQTFSSSQKSFNRISRYPNSQYQVKLLQRFLISQLRCQHFKFPKQTRSKFHCSNSTSNYSCLKLPPSKILCPNLVWEHQCPLDLTFKAQYQSK